MTRRLWKYLWDTLIGRLYMHAACQCIQCPVDLRNYVKLVLFNLDESGIPVLSGLNGQHYSACGDDTWVGTIQL